MTTYMNLDSCQVLCSCKRTKPLCRLYFCKHCLDVRCGDCVSHEVDSHYCPNCLENMASAEAKMRKHRCGNCFDCPSCGHTLSTRATTVLTPGESQVQRGYYLVCNFCRWSTRDSDIPEQLHPGGGWQETKSPNAARITELVESYRHLAVREKADREWSKFVRKPNYKMLLERYPVLNPRLRRYCSASWTTPNQSPKPVSIPAAVASSDPVTFDLASYVDKPLQLEKITTLYQRHMAPHMQPKMTINLEPLPKCLVVKRSLRCRSCEHNLSKADFNPSSTKFRINLSALQHVPEIRFIMVPSEADGKTSVGKKKQVPTPQRRTSGTWSVMHKEPVVYSNCSQGVTQHIVLTICNPAHRTTTFSMRQLNMEEERVLMSDLINSNGGTTQPVTPLLRKASNSKVKVGATSGKITPVMVDASGEAIPEMSESDVRFSTVTLELPSSSFQLERRNDIANYDAGLAISKPTEVTDDPKVVAFRKGNKIGLNVAMTPLNIEESFAFTHPLPLTGIPEDGDDPTLDQPKIDIEHKSRLLYPLRAAIRLKFDHKNTTTNLLIEQRAAMAAATAAAAASTKASEPGPVAGAEETSKTSESAAPSPLTVSTEPQPDKIDEVELTILLYFGNIPLGPRTTN